MLCNMAKGKYVDWITEKGLKQLEEWARDGLTDEQIAHNIGIARQTIYEWKNSYPDIDDALKRGKAVIDLQVENALLKRALGYQYEEVIREPGENVVVDPATGQKKKVLVETKRITKEVHGDTTAQIFWLKNRKPDVWRDRHQMQHSGTLDIRQNIEQLSDEELDKMLEDKN